MLIKSALRDWLSMLYSMKSILLIGSLRSPPPYPASPDFPRKRGQNKTPRNTLFINGSTVSTSYCATELRGWQSRYKKWRRRRRTSPAQRYYIPPEGGRPEPVREASAGPGQNPWRPGPKARRRHQPSRRKTTVGRLNGRPFYGQAKGQLRPTCTSYTGCAHQPSGILESTAQVPIPTTAIYPNSTTFPSPSNIFSVPVTRV